MKETSVYDVYFSISYWWADAEKVHVLKQNLEML